MPSPLEVQSGGGELYFLVSPYFLGGTGTYLLEIQLDRSATNSSEISDAAAVSLYPNPTNDLLFIKSDKSIPYTKMAVFNLKGECILSKPFQASLLNKQQISLKNLAAAAIY